MFQYCAFYGVSAPMFLLFSEREISDITSLQLTTPAAHLLQNLKYECIKLKEILGNPEVVNLEEDSENSSVKYFIAGLNKSLEEQNTQETTAPAEKMDKTNMFGNMSLGELSDTSDLLGDSVADGASDDLDSLLSGLSMPTWHLSSDLVALGQTLPADYAGRFKNFIEIKRYVALTAKRELDAGDLASLQRQYKELPRRPSGRVVINGMLFTLKDSYPPMYKALLAMYQQAFSKVGKTTKIDFIIERITNCLVQSNNSTAKFFGLHFDTLRRISTVYTCNHFVNEAIVKGPLSIASREGKMTILESLIADCDVLLGDRVSSNVIDLTAKPYNLSIVDMSASEVAKYIIGIPEMRSANMSEYEVDLYDILRNLKTLNNGNKVLTNSDELVLLTRIHARLRSLESGGMISGLGLGGIIEDPDELNDIGIEFATKLNIGGIYMGFMNTFYDTLNITDRAIKRTTFGLEPNAAIDSANDIYYDILLVRRYLQSMKARYS
ncbi:MAG: hypothetical protein RSC43_00085 [Clostridia bacterium]